MRAGQRNNKEREREKSFGINTFERQDMSKFVVVVVRCTTRNEMKKQNVKKKMEPNDCV